MRRGMDKLLRTLLIVCAAVLIGFYLFRIKYQKTIISLAESQVKSATSDLINGAIDRQIETGNIQYDRIVYFEKDLNGRITALKTNMSEVNRLKTDTLGLVNADILTLDAESLGIPIEASSYRSFFPAEALVSRLRSWRSETLMPDFPAPFRKPASTRRCSSSIWR